MRLFCELFLLVVVVWLGWSTSFQDRVNHMRGIEPAPEPQVRQAAAATATTTAPRQPFTPRYVAPRPASGSNGDWMWDPNHRSALDGPAKKANAAPAPSVALPANYWIDARGVRHSANTAPSP